jgi:hypothetical protein
MKFIQRVDFIPRTSDRISILNKERINDVDTLLLFLLSDVVSSILSILRGFHTRGKISHAQLSIVIVNYSAAFRHNRLAARYCFHATEIHISNVCGKKKRNLIDTVVLETLVVLHI